MCDEYKTQRTVSLFGAKTLYLKFDERCATQYDYDKVGMRKLMLPFVISVSFLVHGDSVVDQTLNLDGYTSPES